MSGLVSVKENDCLDIDQPIAGQNYVCVSFVSPDDIIKQKELFMFNKYMNQACKSFEDDLDELVKNAGDDFNNKITKEMKSKLQYNMKYDYEQFKSKFDDFKYKYNTELEDMFSKKTDFRTNVRGVKVRGVFDTFAAAEKQAKRLQTSDSSFHVFVGNVGYWLPWDPCADRVNNEVYMEDELNTLIHKYKENAVHKDMMYEQDKRDKIKRATEERLQAEAERKAGEGLEEIDPWMKSRFAEAEQVAESSEPTVATLDAVDSEDTNENNTNDDSNTPKVI